MHNCHGEVMVSVDVSCEWFLRQSFSKGYHLTIENIAISFQLQVCFMFKVTPNNLRFVFPMQEKLKLKNFFCYI